MRGSRTPGAFPGLITGTTLGISDRCLLVEALDQHMIKVKYKRGRRRTKGKRISALFPKVVSSYRSSKMSDLFYLFANCNFVPDRYEDVRPRVITLLRIAIDFYSGNQHTT